MKTEIKKAHDRLAQLNYRKRRRDDQEEVWIRDFFGKLFKINEMINLIKLNGSWY